MHPDRPSRTAPTDPTDPTDPVAPELDLLELLRRRETLYVSLPPLPRRPARPADAETLATRAAMRRYAGPVPLRQGHARPRLGEMLAGRLDLVAIALVLAALALWASRQLAW
jgi:hypothetical protein